MKKRIALLLLTSLCLMNTMPSFAAQSAKVSVVGSTGAEYAALPNGETLKKDVGFKPKTVAALAGGYQFEEGRITELFDLDANGAPINRQKGISFQYKKKDNRSVKTVTLSAQTGTEQSVSENSTLIKYGGVNLYYSHVQANSISWSEDNILYIIMDINKKVTKEELVAMAKELVDLKMDAVDVK